MNDNQTSKGVFAELRVDEVCPTNQDIPLESSTVKKKRVVCTIERTGAPERGVLAKSSL